MSCCAVLGLGGSSSAAVALIYGILQSFKPFDKTFSLEDTVVLAHKIEEKEAKIACGLQDHLAAAYGGVNLWHWRKKDGKLPFIQERINFPNDLERHLLIAYCGIPHESKNINSKWIKKTQQTGISQCITLQR